MKLNRKELNLLLKDSFLLCELGFFISILLFQKSDFLTDIVFAVDRDKVVKSIH